MQIRGPKLAGEVVAKPRRERVQSGAAAGAAASAYGKAAEVSLAGIPEAELTPKVRAALLALMEEVQQLRGELQDSKARISYLERLADEDSLTPLANRRAFVRELGRMVSFAQRYGVPASVLYFDVNGMKEINDRHGHAAGDAALLHVAKLLVDNVRSSDVVGRLGGDEFGVILAQTDDERARAKAESLARTIEATPLSWDGNDIPISAAHGAYSFSGQDDAMQAIAAADRAMYDHKRTQRPA
jgi:diguanylate cyclase (GGDEF)-like protein